MIKQPKQTFLVIAAFLLVTIFATSCSNSADTAKAGTTDTAKAADTSKMATPAADTSMKKTDTTKMDTAATRPIKATN